MIGTILGAVVVGLIVGALARLIMPGKQNIG
ncbi:GlsB/YeaQ/YmgE family stress response membrane protein, partial [Mycobacterium sp. ITM-2017-0098]